mmetsp:Transcript_39066/g.120727  ORF Transcript_39066/g.120727 Transcript_39066/m.120727 type:complete len:241 (+) Transcript_39066:1441-2163(+)
MSRMPCDKATGSVMRRPLTRTSAPSSGVSTDVRMAGRPSAGASCRSTTMTQCCGCIPRPPRTIVASAPDAALASSSSPLEPICVVPTGRQYTRHSDIIGSSLRFTKDGSSWLMLIPTPLRSNVFWRSACVCSVAFSCSSHDICSSCRSFFAISIFSSADSCSYRSAPVAWPAPRGLSGFESSPAAGGVEGAGAGAGAGAVCCVSMRAFRRSISSVSSRIFLDDGSSLIFACVRSCFARSA